MGFSVADAATSRIAGSWRGRNRVLLVAILLLALSLVSYRQQLDEDHRQELLRDLVQLPHGLRHTLTSAQSSLCGSLNQLESVQEPLPRPWLPTLPAAVNDEDDQFPLLPGYGALSNETNLARSKILVAIYACDEQETAAQMHTREILHLAKAMGRTLVMPNFGGKGIPTISNCQPYSFEDIFSLKEANEAGFWTTPWPVYKNWVQALTRGQWSFFSSQMVVLSSNYAWDQVKNLPQKDEDLLSQTCVDHHPYTIEGPRIYISTENQQSMEELVLALQGTRDKEVLFVYFNHKGFLESEEIVDSLVQQRPPWGLWVNAPFPYWNYSSLVTETYQAAVTKLPQDFIAMQWRMERVPPAALDKCSGLFLDAILSGAKQHNTKTIYVAADAPLHPDEPFKSASWDQVFTVGVRAAVAKLMDGLTAAGMEVVTWKDVRPLESENKLHYDLAMDSPGIFDRLIVGKAASWLYAPNQNCGMKSSYLGAIQTMRQDRIGDPTEKNWDKLGMTWIGAPLPGEYWWGIDPEWENWDKVGLASTSN